MSIRGTLSCCICALALAGCAKPPPKPPQPVETKALLSAGADVNPDSSGRASPVVVRVYQLRGDAEFNDADFFAVYDKEKETLGLSLIMRDERTVLPGQQVEFKLALSPDTRYLGALAAFRDIRASRWRSIIGVPEKSKSKKPPERSVHVRIGKDVINVSFNN
jgi:type VI secretion system protein VasD